MEPEIKFCTSADNVNIAYSCAGKGPPFVKAANWVSHLDYDWRSSIWQPFIKEFSRDHMLIRYDQRGSGLSDRKVEDLSLDAFVRDLEIVVDTLSVSRFPLFGVSQGGPVAIAYAVKHPEKVSHMILLGSFATGWKKAAIDKKALEKRLAQLALIRQGWGSRNPAIRQLWSSLCIPDSTPEDAESFNEMQRESVSPESAARIFEAIGEFDVAGQLPYLEVPVLVAHSIGDSVVPFDEGRRLAANIRGAKFLQINSRNHLLMEHEAEWTRFIDEVRNFIDRPYYGVRTLPTVPIVRACPQCGRLYSDPEMGFCLDDGTVLRGVDCDQPTEILPQQKNT